MPSVYDPDNFVGRVNYAASIIANGRNTSRSFDTCFEMYDGDQVAAALLRRAENNPKLAERLPSYVNLDGARTYAATIAGVLTRDLPKLAAETRAKAKAAAESAREERNRRQDAIKDVGRKAPGYRIERTGPYAVIAFNPDGSRFGGEFNDEDQAHYFIGRALAPELPPH